MSRLIESYPHLGELPPLLRDTVTGTPDRRPGSVRRTATIDMAWTTREEPMQLIGRARDLVTPADGDARTLAEASMNATIVGYRKIGSLEVTPHRENIGDLVGCVGGSDLRTAIERALPGEREAATPLYLLLDDIAGTSLIGGFV